MGNENSKYNAIDAIEPFSIKTNKEQTISKITLELMVFC
jgi:hypothetical protein